MDSAAAPTPPVIGRDFFERARARLRLDVPPLPDEAWQTLTGRERGDDRTPLR